MNKYCETNRLILRILHSDWSNQVLDFYTRNKNFLEPFEPDRVSLFYTEAFHNSVLTYEYNQICASRMLRFWIFEKCHPNIIIGSVCLQQIVRGPFLSCVVSYKMDQSYLRRGYATEALTHLIHCAFFEYNLHRIEAYVVPNNTASISLIEKLGFLQEGIAKSSVLLRGKWIDQIRYALVNQYNR